MGELLGLSESAMAAPEAQGIVGARPVDAAASCGWSRSMTIAVIGCHLLGRTPRGGPKAPLGIAQRDKGHRLHMVWDAQECLNLIFSPQVCRGQPCPQAEGTRCQEEILHRQP